MKQFSLILLVLFVTVLVGCSTTQSPFIPIQKNQSIQFNIKDSTFAGLPANGIAPPIKQSYTTESTASTEDLEGEASVDVPVNQPSPAVNPGNE